MTTLQSPDFKVERRFNAQGLRVMSVAWALSDPKAPASVAQKGAATGATTMAAGSAASRASTALPTVPSPLHAAVRAGRLAARAPSATTGLKATGKTSAAAALTDPRQWWVVDARQFFYDDTGRLLGEYDLSSNNRQETVWLGHLPVAAVIDGVTYLVSPDHLGTPRSLQRATNGAEVWRWDGEPFGASYPSPALVEYNLRFAGQVYDAQTGYHYNWMRDYNPATGRYLQPDPIGLEGGLSRYAYVGGNPISRIDPDGLDWFRAWSDQSTPYVVGRDGHPVVPPGGLVSKGIEHFVPAGRTFGQIHGAKVDELRAKGVPDWKANIPTMPGAYWKAVKQEAFNSYVALERDVMNLVPRPFCP